MEPPESAEPAPRPESRGNSGCLRLLLAFGIGALLLVLAFFWVAWRMYPGYDDAVVMITNTSPALAEVRWSHPGPFGIGVGGRDGTDGISPCRAGYDDHWSLAYPAGDHEIDIASATTRRSFPISVPTGGAGTTRFLFLIRADGRIEEVTDDAISAAECPE